MSAPQFTDFKLTRNFIDAIDDLGYKVPTAIQQKAIPVILGGQDVIGIAQTGTGKTAAYLLPLLKKLNYAQLEVPRALIFVPTRELAIQVEEMARALATYTDLRILTLYGGKGKTTQVEALKEGVDLLIATPGRFMDLYLGGHIGLKAVKTLVLDEADRLMDMGFLPQLHAILEVIPRKRQNMLFSATFSDRVEKLSQDFLAFPVKIEIARSQKTTPFIRQYFYLAENFKTKLVLLEQLLSDTSTFSRVLIFTRGKTTAENLGRYLQRKNPEHVQILHSNKGQSTRINAYDAFKSGELRILVATDVAARGIDVTEVSHVINFEISPNYENYIHRIGRTGRAKQKGVAISLVNRVEVYHLQRIESLIKQKIKELPLPADIKEEPYLPGEEKEILRELDMRKQKDDPAYRGAFHEKKPRGSKKSGKDKKKYGGKSKKSRR